jgi:uncharacterized UBP type Zn finger protein
MYAEADNPTDMITEDSKEIYITRTISIPTSKQTLEFTTCNDKPFKLVFRTNDKTIYPQSLILQEEKGFLQGFIDLMSILIDINKNKQDKL